MIQNVQKILKLSSRNENQLDATEVTFPLTILILVTSSADLTVLLALIAASNPDPAPDLCCLLDWKQKFKFLLESLVGKNIMAGLFWSDM